MQVAQYDKVKREAARLASEVERLDKEVIRQKTLRSVFIPAGCAMQQQIVESSVQLSVLELDLHFLCSTLATCRT